MSAVADPRAPVTTHRPPDPHRGSDLPSLCPFLSTAEGTWRSATAVREHRCTAVAPPVPLATEKQRRLCLVDAHVECATYAAAMAARSAAPSPAGPPASRPVARMSPVILDHGRFDVARPAIRVDRATGQAGLVVLLAVAFVAILLARPSAGPGDLALAPGASASGSGPEATAAAIGPSAQPSVAPRTSPTTKPEATNAASSVPSTAPTASAPTASEPVTSGRTYRVKSGDTLSAIAARFDTTTRVLVQLNDIRDPSKLKIGQILKLP
jgi:LysM repeat protein